MHRLRVALLVNPAAGRGASGRRLPALHRALVRAGTSLDVFETRSAADASRVVDECRRRAVDVVAIAGGDGTINAVCQAYVDAAGEPVSGPPIAILPTGSGDDFARSLDLGTSLDAAVDRLVACDPRPFDLGLLQLTTPAGAPAHRAFLNIASFGLAALTDRLVGAAPAWLPGRAAFYLAAVRALAGYRNLPVQVRVDGEPWLESPIVNVMIANGRFFGGGMRIAPEADPADGLFDVVAIGDLGRLATLALTRAVYAGTHVGRRRIGATRGTRVEACPAAPGEVVLIDMDGETPGRLPLTARVAPGAIWIRA